MPEDASTFSLSTVQLGFNLPLPELLRSVERQIARAPVEVAFVFNQQKQLTVSRLGTVDLVRFTAAELSKMQDCILTHNHPRRGPLSREDVEFAHDYDLSELRAVSGRCIFRLLRPVAGWNRARLAEVWDSEERKVVRQFRQDRDRQRAENKMNGLVTTVVKRLSLAMLQEEL